MRVQLISAIALTFCVSACAANSEHKLVLSTKSPVELRAMQARVFDTTNTNKTLRTVIATLQDLGYTVDKVEPDAGTVSGEKLALLHLTATVYPHGQTQTTVRVNVIVIQPGTDTQVDDPLFYQQRIFEPLSKAMFLAAQQVDDPGEPPPAPSKDNAVGKVQ